MRSVLIVLVFLAQSVFVSCSKTDTKEMASNIVIEEYILKDIVAPIGKSEKIMAFNLGLYGEEGLVKDLGSSNDLLRNILLSHLSDFKESEIKNAKLVTKKLKPSFNKFFNGTKISDVKILSLREL